MIFFSANVLELGRNTEQVIEIDAITFDIYDNVLQSLQQWPQHVGEAGSDIPKVVDYRMERVIRNLQVDDHDHCENITYKKCLDQ